VLVQRNLLEVRNLAGASIDWFLDLVAEPHGLDDGEAATIACALDVSAVVVLDERKARRIVREWFPALALTSTAGLFQALLDQGRMDAGSVQRMLLAALQRARMSVPPEEIDWVIGLLGVDLAEQCPSIRRSLIRRFLRSCPGCQAPADRSTWADRKASARRRSPPPVALSSAAARKASFSSGMPMVTRRQSVTQRRADQPQRVGRGRVGARGDAHAGVRIGALFVLMPVPLSVLMPVLLSGRGLGRAGVRAEPVVARQRRGQRGERGGTGRTHGVDGRSGTHETAVRLPTPKRHDDAPVETFRQPAHALTDNLADNASWHELAYTAARRASIDQGVSKADARELIRQDEIEPWCNVSAKTASKHQRRVRRDWAPPPALAVLTRKNN